MIRTFIRETLSLKPLPLKRSPLNSPIALNRLSSLNRLNDSNCLFG